MRARMLHTQRAPCRPAVCAARACLHLHLPRAAQSPGFDIPACARRPAALALFSGALSSNIDTAGALLPSYSTALLYFSGFLIPFNKIPAYWKWFSVIDWIRYAW